MCTLWPRAEQPRCLDACGHSCRSLSRVECSYCLWRLPAHPAFESTWVMGWRPSFFAKGDGILSYVCALIRALESITVCTYFIQHPLWSRCSLRRVVLNFLHFFNRERRCTFEGHPTMHFRARGRSLLVDRCFDSRRMRLRIRMLKCIRFDVLPLGIFACWHVQSCT